MNLRFLTAGESHGRALVAILEGLPAGLPLCSSWIDRELSRRQKGFGRGERMHIEQDRVEILSGVRHGLTLGSPLALLVRNRDWENWQAQMSPDPLPGVKPDRLTVPRPGHADLAGALKYGHRDLRNVLERASARETAARCAAGAAARALLSQFGVDILSHVIQIGPARTELRLEKAGPGLRDRIDESAVRCADEVAAAAMMELIKRAAAEGDTLGGVFEVVAWGVPPGLGSYVHWDRRLDGRLAGSLLAINGIKAVEVGLGFAAASLPGSKVHDEISAGPAGRGIGGFSRKTNRAGGIEGGMSTGEPIVLSAAMKPLPTLRKPLLAVDIDTGESKPAPHERSDICAVPAAAVVGEAVVALELASAFIEKFGGDSLAEMRRNLAGYLEQIQGFQG